jgi:hypothetical protein
VNDRWKLRLTAYRWKSRLSVGIGEGRKQQRALADSIPMAFRVNLFSTIRWIVRTCAPRLKLSLDRPGLGSTLESTQGRSRRDKFAIAFAAYRMPRALTKLLPEDHRSVEKQSCKRQDNNGRPKYQNVCISFWSAVFVFDSVFAIERAV